MYLSRGEVCVPARGDLPGGGVVYLPEGKLCTCPRVSCVSSQEGSCVPARGEACVPARGGVVYLSGGVPAGKAPAWRVYLPGDVYLQGGIVPVHGGVCQHALRQTHRV